MFNPIQPKPDFPKLEEEILKFWEDNKIFEKSLEQTKKGKPYTFYDGPPFATGTPHYGHLLASAVKDLFPRYQTMQGKFVRRRWGWDCHGLPIEEIVERKLGISGKKDIEKLGIKKFNETCRSMVLQYANEWKKTIRRFARWIDFDHSYKTMDRDYMESVWWAFKQIYDKGLVYEGRRVLLYCPRCETPISNFEVAMDNSYQEVTEETVTVKFKVRISPSPSLKGGEYILAWTTTPWTLPGNVALAVGEDIDYVKVQVGEEFYILAKDRLDSLNAQHYTLHATFKGKELVGLEYEPLFNIPAVQNEKAFKVYAADFVNTEDGTGIVHTAVVYGEDDYNLGVKVGLPVVPLLDEKGKFNDKSPKLIRGMYFKDSEKTIKDDLQKRGLLFARQQHKHSYPHCWRCGTALFYNAIPAWFMNIQKIKDGLLETNKNEINWYPEHLKFGRYQKSVEAAPDWNISRNRYWGNPIPVWKCEKCEEKIVVGSIKELGLSSNTFYFARHGEAKQNVLGIISSYPEKEDYDLTQDGVKRAENLGNALKSKGGVDLIFASDLLRTKRTAEIAGKILGVEVKTDERLRELNLGVYNGRLQTEFDKDFPEETRWEKAPEGGETWTQTQGRMLDFINETNKKFKDKKILIVGHGDPFWVLMQYFGSELEYPKYAQPFNLEVSIVDLHRPYIDEVVLDCKKCGGKAYRIKEIFDSWVEAGSMPFAEFHYPFDNKEVFEKRFPAQFVAEYIAQTRAWFYVMHVISYNLFGHAPFENVATTGTILAEDGSKMSKSKNNYPDPWIMMEKYGVDALRFYLMNSVVMLADNLNFSEKDLAVAYRKNVLILWNVFNYFVTYANEANWEPKGNAEPKAALDKWIFAKTTQLSLEVTLELNNYNTVKATRAIENYINDLSTWYLRRSRGRKDEDFFATLRHCLLALSKLIAPIMPYVSEVIYQTLNRKQEVLSVHLASWPETKQLSNEEKKLIADMELVREAVTVGLAARKTLKIPVRQPLYRMAVKAKDLQLSKELAEILLSELNVKNIDSKLESEAESNNKVFGMPGTGNIQYVYFDTIIDRQLKLEGLARNLERQVQEMRKSAGLRVGEEVVLYVGTKDEELVSALEIFDKKKTYIKEIKIEDELAGEALDLEGKKIVLKI